MGKLKGIVGTRGDKGIVVSEHTLWKKTEMAVFAYFARFNNKPSTYRDITRAYVSSSYSNYQKACEQLAKRGWLKKLKDGKFMVNGSNWPNVKKGIEVVKRELPYFQSYLKKLKEREKP